MPTELDKAKSGWREQESGGGIVHIDSERDGLTAMGSVDGVACRYLDVDPQKKTRATTMGYFYFNLDPSFKRTSVQTVKVEVEYRSDAHGTFGLDYDAMAPTKTAHFIYMHTPPVRLSGATNWQTATFHLKDAAFENSQNGGADFRVWVRPPDLNLRRVTVTRETADTLTEKPAPLNR